MKKTIIILTFIVVLAASITYYFNRPQRKLDAFLTFIYTTNYDGRMDKILEEEVNDEDINTYYATIEAITTEELLTKLVNNRIPFVYDLNYSDNPYSVVNVNLEKADAKGKYYYEVVCNNDLSTISFIGEIGINKGKIDYFYEASNKISE